MSDTRKDIFKKIHERCFQFGSCNYKETGCSDCPINVNLVKAETLLDKQEQGLLIELPCKAGSKVYEIVDDCNFGGDCHTRRMCSGCEDRDLHIEPLFLATELSIVSRMKDFGKTVFLTRSEAEEALAQMKGD